MVKRYLASHEVQNLQLGGGPNVLRGWLNSDIYQANPEIIYIDARKKLPFADHTFDYIFSEHLIEHLTYAEGKAMLRECYRVLKTGGKVRLATPDLAALVALYAPENSEVQQKYIKWVVDHFLSETGIYKAPFVINNAFFGWGHQFLYDLDTLRSVLQEAGFSDIQRFLPGRSEDPLLQGIEGHGRGDALNEEMNKFESIVLEAKRPQKGAG
jgi:predicted SAM-dependent methyltransferase